ncbi:hypothetical protein Emed_001320 [Eimeria media]
MADASPSQEAPPDPEEAADVREGSSKGSEDAPVEAAAADAPGTYSEADVVKAKQRSARRRVFWGALVAVASSLVITMLKPLPKEPGEVGEVEPTGPSEAVVPETQTFATRISEGKILPIWKFDEKTFRAVLVRNGVKYTFSAKFLTAPATTDFDKMEALLLEGVPKLLEKCTPNEEQVRTLRNHFLTRDAVLGDTACGKIVFSIEWNVTETKGNRRCLSGKNDMAWAEAHEGRSVTFGGRIVSLRPSKRTGFIAAGFLGALAWL